MLKVRGCLFSRAILTLLVQGQYVVMARQRQQPLFYFSFSSIYSDPTEQMYLTFFSLSFAIRPFLFWSYHSTLLFVYLYPFQTISVTCFIYTYTILCVLFFILLKAEMQGTQYVWQQRKMDRKLKDKAFENYSAEAEERM